MIESFVTQNMIVRGETAIAEYLRTGQSDYTKIINESWTDIMRDIINKNLDIKLLCNRLVLQLAVTKTATFDGAISTEDFANRMRLVLVVTALTGTVGFKLQGTDDDGVTYTDCTLITDADISGVSVSLTSPAGIATSSYIIKNQFTKYRLIISSAPTTVTYSAYLIEDIYTELHLRRTRALIYRTLISATPEYREKYDMYLQDYDKLLEIGRMPYDVDESGVISEDEGVRVSSNITFRA